MKDSLQADESAAAAADRLLHFRRTALLQRRPEAADIEPDDLCCYAIEALLTVLERGSPGPATCMMLADFVRSVLHDAQSSNKRAAALKLGRSVLGVSGDGRPTDAKTREARAIATYQAAADTGVPEAEALARAYDVLYDDTSFARDLTRGKGTKAGPMETEHANLAEKRVQTRLLPLLRSAGLVSPKRAGRPPRKRQGET